VRRTAGAAHLTTMTTPANDQRTSFNIGDEVTANEQMFGRGTLGVVYVITKVPVGARGINYVAKPKDNPTGRGIRAPFAGMVAHQAGTPAPSVIPIPYEPYVQSPPPGAVVTIAGVRGVSPTDLMVVLGDSRSVRNAVRLTRIGGDGGRYFKAVPLANLTIVNPSTIRIA